MKKIYKTALFALVSNFAFAQTFFVPTPYRGAFAPAPAAMWTDNWTEWDPQNAVYPSPTVTISTSITTNTTWTSGNTYLLQGQIFVKNGATLTIQPGTVIEGDKASTGAGLFICQGAKIMAVGTEAQPIVFTSNQAAGSRSIGDWGGIILMGKASNNQPGGVAYIEGLAPTADTQFGGGASPDDNDNSGTMKYVRIEWGGYVYQPNKEINGLTFGSVGSATTIDHIQVSFSNDDAFEWFGGSVNCRYLVSYRNLDDDFDTDFGFAGLIQFGLSVRDPQISDNPSVSTSEGFESDNDASGSTSSPQTRAIFSNMTLIGPYRGDPTSTIATGYRRGARIRRNSALKIYNSIFMDHQRGVHIDGALCETNASNGTLKFMNNIIAGTLAGRITEVNSGSTFNITSWFGANLNDSLVSSSGILTTPYNYTAPDYRPANSSIALNGSNFTDPSIISYVLFAPVVTSPYNYCMNDAGAILVATASGSNTLNWYTVSTGGTPSSLAPTPSTSIAGTFRFYVSQTNYLNVESSRDSIVVNVNALPSPPIITPNGPTSFCTGGTVTLKSDYSTGNNWSTSATEDSIVVTNSGNFTVTETDGNGCQSTSSVTTVNVSSAPLPTVSITGSTTLCQGEMVTLTSSLADSYSWSNGDITQSTIVSTANTYYVTTTNSNACNGVGQSSDIIVAVNPVPVASGSIASVSGSVVSFSNTSTGASSYSWDFGDASNSSAITPVHAYATNGNYTVTLVVSNGNCTDTTSFPVNIVTGVTEVKFSGTNLFPNPMTDQATLELNITETVVVSVIVRDITGKVIKNIFNGKANAGLNVFKFDVNDLPSGIYFTSILSDHENSILKMIIVK